MKMIQKSFVILAVFFISAANVAQSQTGCVECLMRDIEGLKENLAKPFVADPNKWASGENLRLAEMNTQIRHIAESLKTPSADTFGPGRLVYKDTINLMKDSFSYRIAGSNHFINRFDLGNIADLINEAGGLGLGEFIRNKLEQEARNNNVGGVMILADFYLEGRSSLGIFTNISKSFNYYRKASDLGDSRASLKVGQFYEEGFGVAQNFLEAIRYYKRSMKKTGGALEQLGDIYSSGKIPVDYSRSYVYYSAAAAHPAFQGGTHNINQGKRIGEKRDAIRRYIPHDKIFDLQKIAETCLSNFNTCN